MKRLLTLFCLTLSLSVQAVSIVPPSDHPRLLVRPEGVQELRERARSEQGQKIIKSLRKLSKPMSAEEKAAQDWNGFRPWMKMRGSVSEVQLLALAYLTEGNVESGRKAITVTLDTLSRLKLGKQNDLSRATGALMFIAGLVYDWCYPLLTADEKSAYVRELVRNAKRLECGYPAAKSNGVAGHLSEWMTLKDLLGAGIAIYDEYPEMYETTMDALQQVYIPFRNYFYKGGMYHQGSSYVNIRFQSDLTAAWIMRKMCGQELFCPEMGQVPYELIYRRRPDGEVMPAGDNNPPARGKGHNYGSLFMLAGSYFNDPYFRYMFRQNPSVAPQLLIFQLTCGDFSGEMEAPDSLPLVRWFGEPYGSMIARTGWGEDAVICEMKNFEHFVGNHQHLDAGSFNIYYKGPLAIDSGIYQGFPGGKYSDPHNMNYHKRSIAHNCLLIYDPDENSQGARTQDGELKLRADGGLKLRADGNWPSCRNLKEFLGEEYTYGKTTAHYSDETFAHIKCDLTNGYTGKVKDVQRSFVFVNNGPGAVAPATLFVHDHIVSSDRKFKKYFLLHCIEEPVVKGNVSFVRRTLNGDSGVLACTTLIPYDATISTVGGEGKDFWVFGKNYTSTPKNKKALEINEQGRWRLEISPSKPAEEDVIFNVIRIGDEGLISKKFAGPVKVQGTLVDGAVTDNAAVVFSKDGKLLSDDFEFNVSAEKGGSSKGVVGKSGVRMLVTDVAAGRWTVECPDGKSVAAVVSVEENVICLDGTAGHWSFKRCK